MFVLSMLGEDCTSWNVLGVYTTSEKASKAVLNHIIGSGVMLIDYERVELDGEIYYGIVHNEEHVTFMIEHFVVDDTNV